MLMKKDLRRFDLALLIAVIALSIFGIIAIGSADHINIAGIDRSNFNKQIMFFIAGLLLLAIATIVDYIFFSNFYVIYYLIILGLLVFVLFFSPAQREVHRWISIGGITIQPSEFAKIIMIYVNAKILSKYKKNINDIKFLIVLLLINLLPVVLIVKQPSLSAGLVLLFTLIAQIYISDLDYKFITPVVLIAIACLIFLMIDIHRVEPLLEKVGILQDYQTKRILSALYPADYPQEAYQTLKSINAIGSGQFSGKGLYQGTLNQLSYLPERNNDFIFSVVGEEFGFIGCISVLFTLLFIVARCFLIAIKSENTLGKLIAIGVGSMFFFQTFINTGVATGILPNTGMGLPFVSSGGSAMLTNMLAVGLVLNVGMTKQKSLFEEA